MRGRWCWTRVGQVLVCVAMLSAAPCLAQTTNKGAPLLKAVHVEKAPLIDGALDDACWPQASHVTGFTRITKADQEFEPTEAWVCCDDRAIYVAFYCHDSRPLEIHALQRKRGGDIEKDDAVLLSLDVRHDHRTPYTFRLTPRGTQVEDIPGGSADKYEWRGNWAGAARIVDDGWTAEIAVPFSMLRYPSGQSTFGLHFARHLARRSDWSAWPDIGRDLEEADLTRDADWTEVSAPTLRPPVVLMPYTVVDAGGRGGSEATGGLDSRYVMPSGLVTMLSYKPDFRNIEDVVESIDFTYTEKEFPEYRPFFTEGGGKKTEWGESEGTYYPPTMIFYSRRIPFVDTGAKAFGKLGPHSIGLLDAMEPDNVNDVVLGYGYDLGARGKLRFGAVDHRDPADLDNLALHLGTEWAWPQADGSTSFAASVYQGKTEGPGGDGLALYLDSGSWKPNGVGWWGWYQQVGRDFQNVPETSDGDTWRRPVGVGYVPETGIKGGGLSISGSWHPDGGPLESHGWDIGGSAFDDPAGPRWELSGNRYLGRRDNTSWHWGLGLGEREHFAERSLNLEHDWRNKDFYTRGSVGGTLGERLGGRYVFLRLSQGYRPTKDFSWQARLERVRLNAENEADQLSGMQALLTATYDLSDERSISARAVYRRGNTNFWLPQVYYDPDNLPSELQGALPSAQVAKVNLYAAYRQRVARGKDILLILGDPNVPSTEARIAVKMVWTHFLGGL